MDNAFTITSAAITDRGLSDKRPQNEDSYLENPQYGIFAVADGVGGAQAGEVASQMAMEILGEAFINMAPGSDAEHVMELALTQANAAIHQMSSELPQLAQMATTVVALHLDGNIATIGHAGDSRLYRLERDGTLHRETEDHSMVADEVRAGRMTEEQAENHPAKNVINRALGAEPGVELDLTTKIVARDCTYLLCSDGVTRHIPDSELSQILNSGEPEAVCGLIKRLCFERGAEDNLTAVVIRYEGLDPATDLEDTLREDRYSLLDDEAPTVAAAKPQTTSASDDLLELDTAEIELQPAASADDRDLLSMDEVVGTIQPGEIDPQDTLPQFPEAHYDAIPEEIAEVKQPVQQEIAPAPQAERVPSFSSGKSFSDSSNGTAERRTSYVLPAALGSLVLGALIGLGVYHFGFAAAEQPRTEPITEMRTGNIPFTTFEENRRNVDKDPAVYIQKAPPPEDAADHYLLGRAYLLTGDFAKAKESFAKARETIATADPSDVRVITDDILISEAILKDAGVQAGFKKDLDASRPGAANANANSAAHAPR